VGDADIGARSAIHVLKDEMGNMAARIIAQMPDGRKPPVQRRRPALVEIRACEAAGRHGRSVVHQASPVRIAVKND
jgi:hypothetical protein